MSEDDVARLARSLEQIRRKAPDEMRELVRDSAEAKLLPSIRGAAPRRSGKLAGSTKVGINKRYGFVTFYNSTVYANTIHWGRKRQKRYLPAGETITPERRGTRGRRPKSRNYRTIDNPVSANKFIYRGIGRNDSAFRSDLSDKIVEFMEKEIDNG